MHEPVNKDGHFRLVNWNQLFFFNRTWIRYSNSTNQKRRKLGEFSFFSKKKREIESLQIYIIKRRYIDEVFYLSHIYCSFKVNPWCMKKEHEKYFFSIINIFMILILIHNYHVFIFIGNNIKILEETNGSLNSVCYPHWTYFWDIIGRLGVVIKWL